MQKGKEKESNELRATNVGRYAQLVTGRIVSGRVETAIQVSHQTITHAQESPSPAGSSRDDLPFQREELGSQICLPRSLARSFQRIAAPPPDVLQTNTVFLFSTRSHGHTDPNTACTHTMQLRSRHRYRVKIKSNTRLFFMATRNFKRSSFSFQKIPLPPSVPLT